MAKITSKELFNLIQILEYHIKLEDSELRNLAVFRYPKLNRVFPKIFKTKTPERSITGNVIQKYTKGYSWFKGIEIFKNKSNIISLSNNYLDHIKVEEYKKFINQAPLYENDEYLDENLTASNEEEKQVLINARLKHSKWANDLKKIHKRCAICGIEYRELLIAGHIVPYSKSKKKRYKDSNGIVFCVFHDKLFEIGDISFDKDKYLIYNNEKNYQECLKVIKEYDQELKITKQNQKFRFKHPDIKLPNTYDEWWEDIWNNIKEKNDLLDKKNKY